MKALRRARDLGIQRTERRLMRLVQNERAGRMAVSVTGERAEEDPLRSYGVLVILLAVIGSLEESWHRKDSGAVCIVKSSQGLLEGVGPEPGSLRGYRSHGTETNMVGMWTGNGGKEEI